MATTLFSKTLRNASISRCETPESARSTRNARTRRREPASSKYGLLLASWNECFLIYSNLQELDEAKQGIADLEGDLKAERSRLRVLTVEQTRAEREKENVLLQLRRTESDMEDVKLQLQRVKRNSNELEGELRGA